MPRKFTRIMKTPELLEAGVPVEAIPTYCALADYANNKTGLCWPKMTTLASTLKKTVRTIQRHLRALREAGVVEFVERRRWKGRFSSYLYRVVHYANITTGTSCPVVDKPPNKVLRTKPLLNAKQDKEPEKERREREAKRRKEGYDWLFQ